MRVTLVIAAMLLVVGGVHGCNEAVCASLVSKCQLIKSCECDMSDKANCTCCSNCQLCLAQLYTECCSCVGMCPLPNPEDSIFRTSTIEVLPDPIPELFNVLTFEDDALKRWTTHRYPVLFDSLYSKSVNQASAEKTSTEYSQSHGSSGVGLYNCTVAFMSECKSLSQCKLSCKSMGSAKYRWFHDQGCCQCIGETCIDYGLNEAKCLLCAEDDDDEEKEGGEQRHGKEGGEQRHGKEGGEQRHGKEGDDVGYKDVETDEGVIDMKHG